MYFMCRKSHVCLSIVLNAYFLLEIVLTFGLPVAFKIMQPVSVLLYMQNEPQECDFVIYKIHYYKGKIFKSKFKRE